MPAIDYAEARAELERLFVTAEERFRQNPEPQGPADAIEAFRPLFASSVQSYREALLGCCIARLLDDRIDIRFPYINQSEAAYNGRALDERVINPFLHEQEIPASKGPFLATFRRNVSFTDETRRGLRDIAGYDAMLACIELLRAADANDARRDLATLLLHFFVALRDAADVKLARIARLSLDQQRRLVEALLDTPSGGLLPVLLAVALFQTLNECHGLGWEVQWQGINVADRARGAGGDITITKDGATHLAIEVTERTVERARVVSTFNTKISRNAIRDYLFLVTREPPADAREAAGQYFGQGHDVSFLDIKTWIVQVLGTVGTNCRQLFTRKFLDLLDQRSVPAALKVRWNALVQGLLA
jgi:hypothetical protein